MIERLRNLYRQDKFKYTFDRCDKCENFHSYYFDEFDSDAWCDLDLRTEEKNCIKFSEVKK